MPPLSLVEATVSVRGAGVLPSQIVWSAATVPPVTLLTITGIVSEVISLQPLPVAVITTLYHAFSVIAGVV